MGLPVPLPKNPIPLSALRASNLVVVAFGHSSRPLSSNPEYAPAKPLEPSVFILFMPYIDIRSSEKSCIEV